MASAGWAGSQEPVPYASECRALRNSIVRIRRYFQVALWQCVVLSNVKCTLRVKSLGRWSRWQDTVLPCSRILPLTSKDVLGPRIPDVVRVARCRQVGRAQMDKRTIYSRASARCVIAELVFLPFQLFRPGSLSTWTTDVKK